MTALLTRFGRLPTTPLTGLLGVVMLADVVPLLGVLVPGDAAGRKAAARAGRRQRGDRLTGSGPAATGEAGPGAGHQPRARHCGTAGRSAPSVLSLP
ncbi:hypothetical protein OG767_22665 [Micromonospora sp. NBC_01392]|uniref:hypothetical protein n=1 Tax=Micromonospora sp. NBC_01392 TaxID=2903588 RepID=UPI00324A1AE4